MTRIRILHVDDEPDIREVVEMSLGLDPTFTTRHCGSGQEGLSAAAEWQPDIILLDVMMPGMDGPATLAKLRGDSRTADIPVIFMTARAQAREADQFRALGAVGVIAKPFDPMTLAASVRSYIGPAQDPMEELRAGFMLRIDRDAAALSDVRLALTSVNRETDTLEKARHVAHGLAGAGGIYGFAALSNAAARLENAAIAELDRSGSGTETDSALDALLARCMIDRDTGGKPRHASFSGMAAG
jgi:CheY-like chemotaxis protein/HPt (histidine-containing phosphotransfer) domain-containing protein